MIDRCTLTLRYALFAAAATAINIGAQWLSFRVYDGLFALPAAMAVGTLAGLVSKYVLDKRWIFFDTERGFRAHGRKFTLYTLMGVATTALFWTTEVVFDALSDADYMTYLGAVLGLSIGYFTKYQLDRRFVFRGAAP